MKEHKKILNLERVSTSESAFGEAMFFGQLLIIPFFNINIIPSENKNDKEVKEGYIRTAYLVFENVSAIVWEYELSHSIRSAGGECYGGEFYCDGEYYEFWIKYQKGFLFAEKEYDLAKSPWNEKSDVNQDFFKIKNTKSLYKEIIRNIKG